MNLTDNERSNFKIRSVDVKACDVVVQGRYGQREDNTGCR